MFSNKKKNKKENMEAVLLEVGYLIVIEGKMPLFCTSKIPMKRFEAREENVDKFWEVFLAEKDYTVRWGRVNTEGNAQSKSFKDQNECVKEVDKVIKERLEKGYKQTSKDETSFIYVFSDPSSPGKKKWISSVDLGKFLDKEKGHIQKTTT